MGWDFQEDAAEEAAKKVIQKTNHQRTKSKPKKPKAKMGRPRATEEKKVNILVAESTRSRLKKLAVLDDVTMIEYLEDLINKEATKRGIIK